MIHFRNGAKRVLSDDEAVKLHGLALLCIHFVPRKHHQLCTRIGFLNVDAHKFFPAFSPKSIAVDIGVLLAEILSRTAPPYRP
jgi:hypothetical protein